MPINFGGPGVTASTPPSVFSLSAGQTSLIPSGRWEAKTGLYTAVQEFDTISGFWRSIGGGEVSGTVTRIVSDGVNYRFANQSGCAVGALITNAGTLYTSAPVVTASAGASIWRAIVGGAVSTTVTITNGGVNYTYPPQIVIAAPPVGGIQATATCTISGGVINAVTVTNQGAGYTVAPTISVQSDPRENGINGFTPGYNGALTAALTGAGTITGLVCIDHGAPQTAVPTLTFTGGGGSAAAATVIMNWTITSYTVGTGGAGMSGAFAWVTAEDQFPTTAAAYVNPMTQALLVRTRMANIKGTVTAGAIVAKAALAQNDDGGIYTSVPLGIVISTASIVTTAPVITPVMGGVSDHSEIFST